MNQSPAEATNPSQVEVVVTLIRNAEHKLLLVYNQKWGAFTLPMTKLRVPQDDKDPHAQEAEEPIDAAARNVVECLGRLSCPQPMGAGLIPEEKLPEQHLSRRQNKSRLYRFRVFEEALRPGDAIVAPLPWVWLTPGEVIRRQLHPLSPTASALVAYKEIMEEIASWR